MFHNLKGKFQLVQDGISASIRGLKLRDEKTTKSDVPIVNYQAGAEIALTNEKNWNEIHSQSEKNAQLAEIIDKKISEMNDKVKCQLQSLQEINQFFASVPDFTKKIESISSDLESLQNAITEVEEFMVVFEDIVETEEMKQKEIDERFRYTAYIEKRSTEVENFKSKVASEYSDKVSQKEKKIQNTLKERQEIFNIAFQQDMQLYKESGIVPNTIKKQPSTSAVTLDDVVIEDDMDGLNELLES